MLVSIVALLTLTGATADEIKDWLYRRRTATLSDRIFDNLLKVAGLSRYMLYHVERNGFIRGAMKLIEPPVNWIEAPFKDAARIYKALRDGTIKDFKYNEIETVKMAPLVGKFYYEWLGKGVEYEHKAQKEMLEAQMFLPREDRMSKEQFDAFAKDLAEDGFITNTRKNSLIRQRDSKIVQVKKAS